MALSGEEIRQRLIPFAARWSVYDRSERAEAQTFLNQLFDCYGQDRSEVAFFEEPQAGRFVDLIWPRVCIIEMKAPAEANRLERHRDQAFRYWRNASDPEKGIEAPRWVVLCAFRRLEVWEPGRFPQHPRVELDLVDLPDQYDALMFLAKDEPVFVGGHAAVTRDAVLKLSELYHRVGERRAAGPDVLRDFLLQAVWCMFAEDLGQIPGHRFTQIVETLLANSQRSSADELGQLFEWLNSPGTRPQHGLYAGTPYANGGLFEQPARVHLEQEELELLRAACAFNWREVQPSIFGSLLEGGLGHDMQWQFGAHYTHEADIQKVVQPTIVRPWRERIENLSTHGEAVAAQNDLVNYIVLDPACGSGNFLYVAYRELRRLERRLREREEELRRGAGLRDQTALSGLFFPLQNVRGIELNSFAVALARVTLWMGHKLAVDELGVSESTLPLEDLSGIEAGDALRVPWPRADAIVGNPPYHGSQQIRQELGDDYAEWLKTEFGVGLKDYAVYWFRKSHDELPANGRAGLVATNSVSQGRARSVSLDWIAANDGVITDAVSRQPWPGVAVVNVSIVNWVKAPTEPPATFMLDGVEVDGITSSLRPSGVDVSRSVSLPANRGRAFQGPIPADGGGFILTPAEATGLLGREDATYREVARPYLTSDDLGTDPGQAPSRYVIDFGVRSLEDAMQYPAALSIVRDRVKPFRDRNRDRGFREKWWLFGRPRPAMRAAIEGLPRYIAGTRHGTRLHFCFCDPWVMASDAMNVFAFADDYSLGVLASEAHRAWAWAQSSTIREDIRYTPTSVFETFPWPSPVSDEQRATIGSAARAIIERRSEICIQQQVGLTQLYHQVGDGAWADLRQLHRELDEMIVRAYGWPASVASDAAESNARLLALNDEIARGEREYAPFT